MTADRSGPAFSVHDIPFSTYGSWFGISPVLAEKRRAEDLHLVSHQNGMHAVLSLVPLAPATGERAETLIEASPGLLSWTGPDGRGDLAYESPDTVRRARRRSAAQDLGGGPDADPVQRHLLLPRTGRRRLRVHVVRDRPPLPCHRAVRER
ncbi:hypothetical protein SGRIM119S_06327 [Streptomyces griseorubiginosus]